MGIRDLSLVNKALQGKWIWRFAEEESSYWKDVIGLKYIVEDGGWFTKTTRGNSGLGPWMDISRQIVPMKLNFFFAMRDDSRVKILGHLVWGEPP